MLTFTELVFSEYVTGTTTVYTSAAMNSRLARTNQLTLQSNVDQVTAGTTACTVQIEHSNDERNFVAKAGSPEINRTTFSGTVPYVNFGYDAGTTPTMGFVRLAITLAGTNAGANVKIYASGRDPNG